MVVVLELQAPTRMLLRTRSPEDLAEIDMSGYYPIRFSRFLLASRRVSRADGRHYCS